MKTLFYIFFSVCLVFLLAGCFWQQPTARPQNLAPVQNTNIDLFLPPIADYQARVTKKPFGIYIDPATSPVQPEKFLGYHTGTDFEILPGEEDQDIIIKAICEGELLEKRRASGYGGVLVQACLLDNKDITVIYGHLDLVSITAKIGDTLKAGEALGILGDGYSTETDGERQHLHLSIHKGAEINIRGYVSTQAGLVDWYDAIEIINSL